MILSIESSCDDSSIAVTEIKSKKLIFHKKISQDEHSQYGGVVPELASRLHAVTLPKILQETKEYFDKLKAIAVTNEPGLSVTLLEGVMMAKALSLSLDLPLIGVNHLKGHIYSLFIEKNDIFPLTILLVSGGHTQIIEAKSFDEMNLLASTLDDSFGESFDKVAKMLNLGYPGGPIVEKLAKNGDENAVKLPIPLINSKELAFSFSGLKNATRLEIEKEPLTEKRVADICASFQSTATKHLLHKLKKVFRERDVKNFAIVGGASANGYLREKIEQLCIKNRAKLLLSNLEFCSDNSAMVGRCAVEQYKKGDFTDIENLKVNSKFKEF